ncbi:DUF4224 domain-containing protein [Azonexus sp. IMCC34839]|uniref:DUF4224 domain-containing protein n=1 Tax=Azonexus sp. IMCC34839 TaxID=3133695 RepID=UPI0039999587
MNKSPGMPNQGAHLTREEVRELTDRVLPGKQIEWLKQYGWKFAISAAGRPKIARTYYDFRMGAMENEPANDQEPDFSHWTAKTNGGAQKKQPGTGYGQVVRLRREAA